MAWPLQPRKAVADVGPRGHGLHLETSLLTTKGSEIANSSAAWREVSYQVGRLRQAGHTWAEIRGWAGVKPQALHKNHDECCETLGWGPTSWAAARPGRESVPPAVAEDTSAPSGGTFGDTRPSRECRVLSFPVPCPPWLP